MPRTESLNKDRAVLLTFFDFPTENWFLVERWTHLRTGNLIEFILVLSA
jgi:hypothetical protein